MIREYLPVLLQIVVAIGFAVSALLDRPRQARACFVFAHGAGAGMTHAFMESVAQGLAARHVATLLGAKFFLDLLWPLDGLQDAQWAFGID